MPTINVSDAFMNKFSLRSCQLKIHNIFAAKWIIDFIKVWIKMSQNGYGSKDLVQGPKMFWTHT